MLAIIKKLKESAPTYYLGLAGHLVPKPASLFNKIMADLIITSTLQSHLLQ